MRSLLFRFALWILSRSGERVVYGVHLRGGELRVHRASERGVHFIDCDIAGAKLLVDSTETVYRARFRRCEIAVPRGTYFLHCQFDETNLYHDKDEA